MSRAQQSIAALCFAACAFAAIAAEPAPASRADARALLDEVNRHGARRTVLRLQDDPREWSNVIERVAAGRRGWIDVALALKPGTEAAAGVELRDAMFRALQRNPAYVLAHAQVGGFPLAVLCLGRGNSLPAYEKAAAEFAAAKKALMQLQTGSLRFKKELCLGQLEAGRAALRHGFGVSVESADH